MIGIKHLSFPTYISLILKIMTLGVIPFLSGVGYVHPLLYGYKTSHILKNIAKGTRKFGRVGTHPVSDNAIGMFASTRYSKGQLSTL